MQNWQIPHRISQLSNAVQVQGEKGNGESPRNPHQYPSFSFRFLHLLPEIQDEIEVLLKGLGFPLNFLLGAKKKESLVMKSVAVCVPKNRCRHSSAVYPSIPHFPPCHMLYYISLYAAYPSSACGDSRQVKYSIKFQLLLVGLLGNVSFEHLNGLIAQSHRNNIGRSLKVKTISHKLFLCVTNFEKTIQKYLNC